MNKTREVQVNERGRRIGESHPRAKFTDKEIDMIREMAEPELDAQGKVVKPGLTYAEIAAKFDEPNRPLARETVKSIVLCRRRGQTPAKVKRIKVAA